MIEELLKFFIRKIDADLFKTIELRGGGKQKQLYLA